MCIPKALVFDLDETLLNSAKEIGPRTRGALNRWLASGRAVVLATARPIRTVRKVVAPDLFVTCEIITMNGAVQHSRGLRSFKAPGLGEAARRIVERFPVGDRVHVTVEMEGESFGANEVVSDEELMQRNAATPDMVVDLGEIDYETVAKVAVSGRGQCIEDWVPWLVALGVDPLVCEGGTFINVMARGVDKSTTLARHMAAQGWGREDIAVFGDDLIDIKMMALSDHAVAMANARPEVKAVAHHIIGNCNDDVIGPYIERWLQ